MTILINVRKEKGNNIQTAFWWANIMGKSEYKDLAQTQTINENISSILFLILH
jgi:hypothetical protein